MDKLTLDLREQIDSSAVAIILITENYGNDLKSCAELGMCIMLNKPMLGVIHESRREEFQRNTTLRRALIDWAYFHDGESCNNAVETLLRRQGNLFEPDKTYRGKPFTPKPDQPSVN